MQDRGDIGQQTLISESVVIMLGLDPSTELKVSYNSTSVYFAAQRSLRAAIESHKLGRK